MNDSEFIKYLFQEKESAHSDFIKYNDLLIKLLTISTSILLGIFVLGIEKSYDQLIALIPFLAMVLLGLLKFISLASYFSDETTRIYERIINKFTSERICFKTSKVQNALHNHDNQTGFAFTSLISALLIFSIVLSFYCYCVYKGYFHLETTNPSLSIFYLIILIIIPLLIGVSFVLAKIKLDKELKSSEFELTSDVNRRLLRTKKTR